MSDAPYIWIPKFKIFEPKKEIVTATRCQGFYKLDVRRPDGRLRDTTGWFPNLLLDSWIDEVGVASSWLQQCRVGSGNSTPNASQTALDNQIATTTTALTTSSVNSGSPDYYSTWTRTYRFNTGAAEGNIAEVGIGRSGSNPLISRALVLDGLGNPTTITVLSDEILDVSYQFRTYPYLEDVETEITITGSGTHDVLLRPANVDTFGFASDVHGFNGGSASGNTSAYGSAATLGTITGTPSSNGSGSTTTASTADLTYGSGNSYRDFTKTWSVSQGNNTGGMGALAISYGGTAFDGSLGRVQMSFNPAIPKTSSHTLQLVFRHSWAKYTP